jgi:hypothetical protein
MTILDLLDSLGPSFDAADAVEQDLAQTHLLARQFEREFERESALVRDALDSLTGPRALLQDALDARDLPAMRAPTLAIDAFERLELVDDAAEVAAQLRRDLEQREELLKAFRAPAPEWSGMPDVAVTRAVEQLSRGYAVRDDALAEAAEEARRVAAQLDATTWTLLLVYPLTPGFARGGQQHGD